MSTIKKSAITGLLIALSVVLPWAFHTIPNAGSIFLPIHIPALLCGLICGAPYGLVCGIIGPMLSSLITAMPPAAALPAMVVECALYGLVTGLLMRFVHTKKLYADLYISLITAMLIGRVLSGIAKALIFAPETSLTVWATGAFVTALPGIVIQLIFMPAIYKALESSRLIPKRYS